MKQAFLKAGGRSKYEVLGPFDYLYNENPMEIIYEKNKKPCRHDQKDFEWNSAE